MQRKGQAAMEFLMTYGWAILAAVIAIGVLAYFGVFNPGTFVQDSVNVNAPLNARGAVASSSSGVSIELLNGAGETLNVTSISITNCNSGGQTFGTNHPTANTTVYTITCSPALVSGETLRGDITVRYKRQNSQLELQSTGSIISKIA